MFAVSFGGLEHNLQNMLTISSSFYVCIVFLEPVANSKEMWVSRRSDGKECIMSKDESQWSSGSLCPREMLISSTHFNSHNRRMKLVQDTHATI